MSSRQTQTVPQQLVANPSAFFVERLLENSNLEMDWWWAAGEVTDPQERRYCLQRVLAINPFNETVAAELATLERSLMAKERVQRVIAQPKLLVRRLFGYA
jgi:hypothetical protein